MGALRKMTKDFEALIDPMVGGDSGIPTPWRVFNQANASWWRPSVGVTLSGSDIDSVVDQGGMARNLTGLAGAKPKIGTDSFGRKYFDFATAASFTFNITNYATVADDFQFIIVFSPDETAIPCPTEKRFFGMVNGTRLTCGY